MRKAGILLQPADGNASKNHIRRPNGGGSSRTGFCDRDRPGTRRICSQGPEGRRLPESTEIDIFLVLKRWAYRTIRPPPKFFKWKTEFQTALAGQIIPKVSGRGR